MDIVVKIFTQTKPILKFVWARYTGQFVLHLIICAPQLRQAACPRFPVLQLALPAKLCSATVCF